MPASALVGYLQGKAGESLRGVIYYDGSAIEVRYLRDDLRERVGDRRLKHRFETMVDRLCAEADPAEPAAFAFGDLHATLRRFDEAIVLHFPIGVAEGVVVSLEPAVAQNFNVFIEGCLRRIHESTILD